ncbi:hypothetical protein ACFQHO_39010 [Actinomadura yumaensis]|uniref:hypothetical protein n=1 Tax=Actinomadura yumaensis TaxID=111807 RepID=UPI00361DFEBC
MGPHLARLETRIALERLFTRHPHLTLAADPATLPQSPASSPTQQPPSPSTSPDPQPQPQPPHRQAALPPIPYPSTLRRHTPSRRHGMASRQPCFRSTNPARNSRVAGSTAYSTVPAMPRVRSTL